ncbi:MAG TPA: 50S ribosomal protein L29 [Candidatus Saccharimonadales bacterium]|nr:50S ribosomal protein L29 [Candidatus Saccharimonadales bacterium]
MNKEFKELKNINNIEEFKKKLTESERALLDLRVDNKLRKLKNGKALKQKRKEIAFIKTRIHEGELAQNAG